MKNTLNNSGIYSTSKIKLYTKMYQSVIMAIITAVIIKLGIGKGLAVLLLFVFAFCTKKQVNDFYSANTICIQASV